MATSTHAVEALERRFWQTMVDKDAAAAKALIAEECVISGTMGAQQITPDVYEKMTEEGKWELETFEFSDVSVVAPSDDTAIIAYKVRQRGSMKGKPMDMTCADSSTWVRQDGAWKCAAHSEAVMQD